MNRLVRLRAVSLTTFSSIRALCSTTAENHYALLGVPQHFSVDSDTLSNRFKNLQRQWHPDKFARKPLRQQQDAADMSARINIAYDILRDPHRRALHLLHLQAHHPSSNLPPDFLHWVLQFRESVSEAAETDNVNHLRNLHHELIPLVDACLLRLAAAFEENRLDDAAIEATKLNYMTSIQHALDKATPSFTTR